MVRQSGKRGVAHAANGFTAPLAPGAVNFSQPRVSGTASGNRGNTPMSPLEDLMRRKGVDEAWSALEEMQRMGLKTDRFTVSRMLMKTLADGRKNMDQLKTRKSIQLVEQFITLQPEEADEVLFNALLDAHSNLKDTAKLDETFQRMKELNIQPSHVTLGIMVKAFGQACDFKQVMRLWDELVEQREQANAITYGCMMNACVKCGQIEKAAEIFRGMKQARKQCNTILYTTLIKGYGNEKDLQNALLLFREMGEEGVPYNTIAFNSIIDVCVKCEDMQSAEDVFRQMISLGNFQPDLITYSTLLKGYCQVGDLDKALQVAETIKACGMQCDELVYNTLLDGCVKVNDLSAGVGLFAEMVQAGMRPSSITHSIFLRLYQRNGYKNAREAVTTLYEHHGVEKPPKSVELGNKNNGNRKNRDRQNRNSSSQNWSFVPSYADGNGGCLELGLGSQHSIPQQVHMPNQQPPYATLLGRESLQFAEMRHYMPQCGDAAMRMPSEASVQGPLVAGKQFFPYGIVSTPQTFHGVNLDNMPMQHPALPGHGMAAPLPQ